MLNFESNYINTMPEKSLFEQHQEARKKAREEYQKLSAEEKKAYRKAKRNQVKKWNNTAWY